MVNDQDQLKEKFNKEHQSNHYFQKSPSLVALIEKAINRSTPPPFQIAELGCGQGFQLSFTKLKNCKIDAYDFSHEAIKKLKTDLDVSTHVQDLTEVALPKNKYDMIVDSHLLHNIPMSHERRGFVLNSIFNALTPGGHFVLEHMISFREMRFPKGYHFDESFMDLYKGNTPLRHIPTAIEIEKEILSSKFSIEILQAPFGLKMVLDPSEGEVKSTDPDLIQMIVKKV